MIKLEALTGHHDRSGFDCGEPQLNAWLKQTAWQHQAKGVSRTFVATPLDQAAVQSHVGSGYREIQANSILGYYALASAFVLVEQLPHELTKKYPRQIPVTRLGRLATRSDMQGQGLGALLLADAVNRAKSAALAVGSAGIFVDAKNEDAARFYARYGFRPCADQALKLYLSIW